MLPSQCAQYIQKKKKVTRGSKRYRDASLRISSEKKLKQFFQKRKQFKFCLVFCYLGVSEMAGLSKNQNLILQFLEVKPEMTTKELAEMVFDKPIEYKSKEYSSTYRSLLSLERQGLIKRVQIQLRWKLKTKR